MQGDQRKKPLIQNRPKGSIIVENFRKPKTSKELTQMQEDQQVEQIKLKLKGMEVAAEVMAQNSGTDLFGLGYEAAVTQMKEFIEQLETSGG